ncbi:methyl-accepting chemotaxis protein, partial [Acinetobacter baumannii]
IVTEIRSASERIHQRSKEIAQGNADLSERTERQAAHLEETAASTEQLTATVKRNAEHSQHAHSLAAETRAQAADSQAVVGRVVNT